MSTELRETERRVLETHRKHAGDGAGFVDGRRVRQWDNATSVYFAGTGRLWVHNDTARRQARQDLYFHSVDSVCGTLTCSHALKFWDLERIATPRELLRVQGFPEELVCPPTRVQRLVGNAVAVPCATHACRCVVDEGEAVRHVDLCAGIGGFACAAREATAGAAIGVGFSEINPSAIKCYTLNFPDVPALGDATAVAEWPEADLLTAGFPCQPFSTANTSDHRESHAARDFFRVVLDAIGRCGATRVVLENVSTLPFHGRACWEALLAGLADLGFETLEHAVLNAHELGVPQRRKRLYLVARRDGRPLSRSLLDHEPLPPTRLADILER